jgi:hypothetical protein
MRAASAIRRIVVLTPSLSAVAAAQAPKDDSADATAFASIAAREVAQLNDGISLAKWMDARGKAERWESVKPEIVITEFNQECLSLVGTEALPSGAKITRALYFYPPPAPSPVAFPTSNAQELIGQCIIGMLEIEAEAPMRQTGHALDQAVRQRLTQQYGESIGVKNVPFWGRSTYEGAARWIHNAEIVAGTDARSGLNDDAPGQLVHGPVAFVVARLPIIKKLEHDEACCTIQDHDYRTTASVQFHRAVAIAGFDAAISASFETLYQQVVQATSPAQAQQPGTWQKSFLPALQEWFAALKAVPPARRAAGLLAADRLLEAAESAGNVPGWPQEPDQRTALRRLGAVFEMNEIAGNYFYTGNWQKQARELDPNGPVREMAVLGSMMRGSCNTAGPNLFQQVISDGESLLAKGPDPSTAAQVHFMVGDAYSDIVAIAGGQAGPNGEYDPEQFRGEADSSHAKALQHYRAGLAVDNTSHNAKDAWRQAWRLSAGLLPSERYVCLSD